MRLSAVLVCLLLGSNLYAQSCRAVTVRSYGYNAVPVVATPVVQTAQYPTYNHGYNQNQLIVSKAFFAEVSQPFYLGVSDDYRRDFFAERVAEKYFQLVQSYAAAQKQQTGDTGKAPTGDGGLTGNVPPLSFKQQSKIGVILSNRCVSCHKPGKTEPDLSGNPDDIDEVTRLKCLAELTLNNMPKGKPPLPQNEFDEFGVWVKQKVVSKIPKAVVVPPITGLPIPMELPEKNAVVDPKAAIQEKKK